jgi:(p)ppGpp synthase/HD superfamily hydrolase
MDAFKWACELHTLDVRKGSDIPYIGHLLGVASSVIEAGGSENQAMAAFLHDSVEDTSTSIEQIAERINPAVAGIVAACTDATAEQKAVEKQIRKSLSRED